MLIPIGFFGAGAAAGSYELIETAYGTGSSGTITFSSIPSTYKHLQIRAVSRSSTNATNVGLQIRFNNDTGTNYTLHRLFGDGSVVTSQGYASLTSGYAGLTAGLNAATNVYASSILDILDFSSSTTYKTIKSFAGRYADDVRLTLQSSVWRNTSAITTITLHDFGGSFTTASRFSLYGIKG